MVQGEIISDSGSFSENGEELALALPPFMPTGPTSGNFKILDVIGRGFDRLDGDVRAIDEATTVQTANSIEEIGKLAALVNSRPKEGQQKEQYRTQVIASFQEVTGEGTINDLISNVATLLNSRKDEIRYDPEELRPGVVTVEIPKSGIDSIGMTEAQFLEVLNDQVAAGYKIEARFLGTFTFRTVSQYDTGTNDPDAGYTGLTAEGEPDTTMGGTYAGILT